MGNDIIPKMQESCGWWRAVIKMIKGDFHVVEYLGWETTYTEIVTSDRLRSKSQGYRSDGNIELTLADCMQPLCLQPMCNHKAVK